MNKQTNIYNSRSVEDRKMDTLIGLSKGLLADGKLVQEEVEFLLQWLLQNRDSNNPIIINIETKVIEILNDGIVDNEEAEELFQLLSKLNGDEVALGELAKPTNLPLCSPRPRSENTRFHFSFYRNIQLRNPREMHKFGRGTRGRYWKVSY